MMFLYCGTLSAELKQIAFFFFDKHFLCEHTDFITLYMRLPERASLSDGYVASP